MELESSAIGIEGVADGVSEEMGGGRRWDLKRSSRIDDELEAMDWSGGTTTGSKKSLPGLGFLVDELEGRRQRRTPRLTAMNGGDKLILRGLKFHGFHGVKQEERKLGQKFVIDVDASLDLRPAGISDNLADTVSYTDIYSIVRDVVEGTPQNLLESVAHLIASTTLTKFPQISSVRVHVGKPHVAVLGSVDYLGVEIIRYRKMDAES